MVLLLGLILVGFTSEARSALTLRSTEKEPQRVLQLPSSVLHGSPVRLIETPLVLTACSAELLKDREVLGLHLAERTRTLAIVYLLPVPFLETSALLHALLDAGHDNSRVLVARRQVESAADSALRSPRPVNVAVAEHDGERHGEQ